MRSLRLFRRGLELTQLIVTPEGLHLFLAASVYTRIRIVQKLLPLLTVAASRTPLARVLNVAGGTYEGEVNTADLTALKTPLTKFRPHLSSMHTLSLEVLAQKAPGVSFVHDFPGAVYTNLGKNASGVVAMLYRTIITLLYLILGNWMFVSLEESGERHVFLATSKKYPPREGNAGGVSLGDFGVAKGSDDVVGSGMYSVNYDGEKRNEESTTVLKELRRKGVKEIVWNHITAEFVRIAGDDDALGTQGLAGQ
jgi:hypothetical protein